MAMRRRFGVLSILSAALAVGIAVIAMTVTPAPRGKRLLTTATRINGLRPPDQFSDYLLDRPYAAKYLALWRPRTFGEDFLGFIDYEFSVARVGMELPVVDGDMLNIYWLRNLDDLRHDRSAGINCEIKHQTAAYFDERDAIDRRMKRAVKFGNTKIADLEMTNLEKLIARKRPSLTNIPDDICTTTNTQPLGVFPDHRALFLDSELPQKVSSERHALIAFTTAATPASVTRTDVTLPAGVVSIESAALAPDGHAIVWRVYRDRRLRGAVRLAEQLGARDWHLLDNTAFSRWLATPADFELWTSDPDGKNFHLVGSLRPEDGRINDVGWLTDGRIGFRILSSVDRNNGEYAIAP